MNIMYAGGSVKNNSVSFAWISDPFHKQKEFEDDMRKIFRSDNDPERPPKREPGDKYILIGAIIGLIIGGILGAVIGWLFFSIAGVLLGIILGFIIGGVAGVYIGDAIKKRRPRTEDDSLEQPD
jgi:MFS family permease